MENDQLRTLLLTTNRWVPDGCRIGLAHGLRFERAGGAPIDGFAHVAAGPAAAGRH